MEQLQSGKTAELEVTGQEGSRWVLRGAEDDIMLNISDSEEGVAVGDEHALGHAVHGDPEPAKILSERIQKELGWLVAVPQMGESATLD